MSDNSDTKRTNPDVDEQLLGDFKATVQLGNDGKVKGRYSPSVEEAMKLYLAVWSANNHGLVRDAESIIDEEDVNGSIEDYRERLTEYANQANQSVQEAAYMLEVEEVGGPTRLDELLEVSDPTEKHETDHYSIF